MRSLRTLPGPIFRSPAIGLLFGILCLSFHGARVGIPDEKPPSNPPPAFEKLPRHPVALAVVDQGRYVLSANRRTGTISVVATATNRVIAEHPVAETLSDLRPFRDDRYLLATDESAHRLLLLDRNQSAIAVAGHLEVAAYPVSVCIADEGRLAIVASLWSRQLTVVGCEASTDGHPQLRLERMIPLPFPPRMMQWIPAEKKLIVADAFGGQIAVVDPRVPDLESVRELPAHNIRGLALSHGGDRLLVSHQTLSRLAQTSFEDVHWGRLIRNVVHSLDLASVLAPRGDILRGSRRIQLGDVGQAAGDPAEIVDGRIPGGEHRTVVACAGVGEVAIFKEGSPAQQRIPIGRTPAVVVGSPDKPGAFYVADTLGDQIAVLNVSADHLEDAAKVVQAMIPLAPNIELTAADQGELLFHDAKLSHDGWMSCQSCHTDGHSSGLVNDNRGDGSFDAPKRILSLRGVADTAPFAWNGKIPSLEDQIRKSIATTMIGPELTNEQVDALAAYLRTLSPAPALGPISSHGERNEIAAAAERGRQHFAAWNCARCHAEPSYTSEGTYNVGLEDEVGNTEFNPPSLRGVSQRDHLFHDNRAGSLEEVFTKFRHQVPEGTGDKELADLIEFLRSL